MISRIVLIVTSGSLRYKRVFIFAGIQFPFLGGLIVIHDVPTGALAFWSISSMSWWPYNISLSCWFASSRDSLHARWNMVSSIDELFIWISSCDLENRLRQLESIQRILSNSFTNVLPCFGNTNQIPSCSCSCSETRATPSKQTTPKFQGVSRTLVSRTRFNQFDFFCTKLRWRLGVQVQVS